MLKNILHILEGFIELLNQKTTLFVYLALSIITLLIMIYIFSQNKELGKCKITVMVLIIPVMLLIVPSFFAYKYREDVSQHCILNMRLLFFTEDGTVLERSEGEMSRISIRSDENETYILIFNLSYPENTQMKILGEISGHLPEYNMIEIHQISIIEFGEVLEQIEKNEDGFFVLPSYYTNVPEIKIRLPEIYLEGDFGFYLYFFSNFPINEVEISFEDYLPIYTADGQLNGITSILFNNREPKDTFERYIWLRRVSLNTTILIAIFSVMTSVLYFFLSTVLGLRIFSLQSHKNRIGSLWKEFEGIERKY